MSIVTDPEDGAVQLHHTEAPPLSAEWSGSPVSLVAPALFPFVEAGRPLSVVPGNPSFAGGAWIAS